MTISLMKSCLILCRYLKFVQQELQPRKNEASSAERCLSFQPLSGIFRASAGGCTFSWLWL